MLLDPAKNFMLVWEMMEKSETDLQFSEVTMPSAYKHGKP